MECFPCPEVCGVSRGLLASINSIAACTQSTYSTLQDLVTFFVPELAKMPSSGSTGRSFAPAFAKKKKEDDDVEFQDEASSASTRRGSKRKDIDYDEFDRSRYSFLKGREYNQSTHWSTYDPDKKVKNYNFGQAPQDDGSQPEAPGPWNNWGVKTSGNADGSNDVKNLFVGVDEIMTHDKGPRNAFEAANKSAFGFGSKSKTIVNEIGGQSIGEITIKRDDRVQFLDENGNYIDGLDRGQLPKRILEEHARRVKQWKNEIAHASFAKSEWDSLDHKEQARRRDEAVFNMQEMLKSLELEEEEEVPQDYQQEARDTSRVIELIEDELPLFVGDSDDEDSSTINTSTTTTSSLSRSSQRVTFKLQKKSAPRPLNEIGRDILKVTTEKVDSSYKDLTIRSRSISHSQTRPSVQQPTSSRQSSQGSLPKGPRNQMTFGRGRGRRLPMRPPPPPPQTPVSKPMSETSLFSIEKFPNILPLADIEGNAETAVLEIPNQNMTKYWKIFQQTLNAPRLVIVQLHRNLNFSSEAVVSRIFGGNVQEFQYVTLDLILLKSVLLITSHRFFPNTKQALIAFLYPWEAAAFFNHVTSARRVDHEFRRLQLATHWHMANEEKGIFEMQENIVKQVLKEGATRVLHVKGIDKRINHDMLLGIFKDRFPNLVRLKLVVPTKLYEREDVNSNSIIMEFSSELPSGSPFPFPPFISPSTNTHCQASSTPSTPTKNSSPPLPCTGTIPRPYPPTLPTPAPNLSPRSPGATVSTAVPLQLSPIRSLLKTRNPRRER